MRTKLPIVYARVPYWAFWWFQLLVPTCVESRDL